MLFKFYTALRAVVSACTSTKQGVLGTVSDCRISSKNEIRSFREGGGFEANSFSELHFRTYFGEHDFPTMYLSKQNLINQEFIYVLPLALCLHNKYT